VRFSRRALYGLRAVLGLVGAGVVPVSYLAEREGIPMAFLEKILLDLRRSGLIASVRGAQGGYCLAVPAGEVCVAEIFEALGEGFTPIGHDDDSFATVLEARIGGEVRRCLEGMSLADLYFDWCSWQAQRSGGGEFMI